MLIKERNLNMAQKEYISWDKFGKMCSLLSDRLKTEPRRIDVVFGVPRGGLLLAVYLSHHLNVPLLQHVSWGIDHIKGYILVVDDISDTGITLSNIKSRLDRAGKKYIITTLHYKPQTIVKPDYYISETDKWIEYPWETKDEIPSEYHQKLYPEYFDSCGCDPSQEDLWDLEGGKSIE